MAFLAIRLKRKLNVGHAEDTKWTLSGKKGVY